MVDNLADSGAGSLREAILQANASPGADTIEFASGARSGTIALESGELEISESLKINGPGSAVLVIDAQNDSRVFNFSSATGDLLLDRITLTGGSTSSRGGGVFFASTGMLTVSNSTVSNNHTDGFSAAGGGIYNGFGNLMLNHAVIKGEQHVGIEGVRWWRLLKKRVAYDS